MHWLTHQWFQDRHARPVFINDTAVRIRAGMLLAIPLFMGFTLYDIISHSHWLPIENTAQDTFETDWDDRIIYTVEAVRRTYDYSLQTALLLYALFEMIAGMFVWTAWLSPTIWLSSLLAKAQPAVWKPLTPKRYAWSIGASLISVCLVFFNPEVFAGWVNALAGETWLPTTENYMPYWIPVSFVWVCIGFMWSETVLGFCVGCKVHALLVRLGVHQEHCAACSNIDWQAIAQRKNSNDG